MTELELRRLLLDVFAGVNVPGLESVDIRMKFLALGSNVHLDSLEMDSFTILRICLEIESLLDIEIGPEQLSNTKTLESLVGWLMRELK